MPDPLARLTRRRFLVSGGAAALAAGTTGGFAATAAARPGWLLRRSYAGRVGQPFTARPAGGQTTWLKLTAVEDLAGSSPRGARLAGRDDAFLLTFKRTTGPEFAQGPVELRNKDLGRTTLFVVPGAAAGTYVLVVNRTP